MNTYTQSDLESAVLHLCFAPTVEWAIRNRVSTLPVYFHMELAGPGGARFALYRQPHHSDDDIVQAKRYLKAERDVVGSIRILLPESK